MDEKETSILVSGLDWDMVWESIVAAVGGVALDRSISLDKQLDKDWKRRQVEQKIAQLEKKARAERQPRRKLDLV